MSSILKREDGDSMFIRIVGVTRRQIPEECHLHTSRRENLKSQCFMFFLDNHVIEENGASLTLC